MLAVWNLKLNSLARRWHSNTVCKKAGGGGERTDYAREPSAQDGKNKEQRIGEVRQPRSLLGQNFETLFSGF